MSDYQPPLRDMMFVINELIGLDQLNHLSGYEEATPDLADAILEQAGVLASEVFSPLNHSGDQTGSVLDADKVVTPEGFNEAYQQYVESGWQGLNQPTEYDGQGMPYLIQSGVAEMWNSSNMALALCPLLTSGAIEAIHSHASDQLKQTYLPKMVAGEWTGTMNLTEPQAGSDLSAVNSKAVPEADYYRITGQKIFITWGEHEMSENIIHLVLARLPDAPEGVKGISLFLVPKFLLNEDGSPGKKNDLKVVSLEKKLGIHASPTCFMSFGDDEGGAIGYLIGEEHNGLACMFTMMNHARLEVGLEGVGLCARAYQHAREYAQERIQGFVAGNKQRVSIIHHPDVRRMLMLMRSITEASRCVSYYATYLQDLAHKTEDQDQRNKTRTQLELITPVVKAWCTEMAQEVAYLGIQIHGGMGFVEETGAAQYYRDARIITIYEGTTGIQALDLIGRKILRDKGAAMGEFLQEVKSLLDSIPDQDEDLQMIRVRLSSAYEALESTTQWYLKSVTEDANLPGSIAVNFLMMMGHVMGGWLMAKSAIVSKQQMDNGASDPFYRNKIKTAVYYAQHVLPRCDGLQYTVQSGSSSVMSIDADEFE